MVVTFIGHSPRSRPMAVIDLSDKYPERSALQKKILEEMRDVPQDLYSFRGEKSTLTFRCHPSVLVMLMNNITEKTDALSYSVLWLSGRKIGISHVSGSPPEMNPERFQTEKWTRLWDIVSS